MGFRITTPPAEMPVSLDEARTAARANDSELDVEIRARVAALTSKAEHTIGQAIINRTGRLTLASFPDLIEIPMTPVGSVTEITYFDASGGEMTLAPDAYFLNDSGEIERSPDYEWPETQERSNAVTVDVVCGYGADDSSTPPAFKGYILEKVREYFAPPGAPASSDAERMLDSLKVYD